MPFSPANEKQGSTQQSRPSDIDVKPPPPVEAPPPLPPGPPPGPAPLMHTSGAGVYVTPPLSQALVPPVYTFGVNSSAPLPGFSFQTSHGSLAQFPEQVYPSWSNQSDRLLPPQGPSRFYAERRRAPMYSQREEFRNERRRERLRSRPGTQGPSFRPLLTSQRGTTPEQMSELTEESRGGKRFIFLDDLSDSQEEDMDVESQSQASLDNGAMVGSTNIMEPSPEDQNEPPRKRQAQGLQRSDDVASLSVPKWSNPDPYTALPPPDESQRKKKDVVKLIRKARVASTQHDSPSNGLETDADFISLNFEDEAEENVEMEQEDDLSDDTRSMQLKAPSGPQSLSQTGEHQTQNRRPPTASTEAGSSAMAGYPDVSLPQRPSAGGDALGNRKRTHRDEIRDIGLPQPLADTRAYPGPGILREWKAKGNVNPVPWCDVDHSTTQNLGFWLHKEICDFYSYVRPREFEQEVRENLLQRLRSTVVSAYPDCDIRCFGSFPAGIYLPTADMDVVCVTNHLLATGRPTPGFSVTQNFLRKFSQYLKSKGLIKPGCLDVVAHAKVPLIKFVDPVSNLRVDLSFENPTGLVAVNTYLAWKHQFPAMPIIVIIIKQLLAMRGLNEVRSGGLGGFSITCMVTSLLQNMPQVQSGSMIPEHHLGDILMEFLDLYGKKFNTFTTGIRLSPPGYFDKRSAPNQPYRSQQNLGRLTIEDPNNPDNDISGGTKNIDLILAAFSRAFDTLQEKMFELHRAVFSERRGQSILGTILAGNYSSYDLQREHLRRVHEGRSEEAPEQTPIVLDNTVQRPPGGRPLNDDSTAKRVGANQGVVAPSLPLINPAEKTKGKAKVGKKAEKQAISRKSSSTQNQKRLDAKVKRRQRARMLRRLFPHAQDIPAEVGRNLAKSLKKKYEGSAGLPSALSQAQGSQGTVKVEGTKSKAKRKRTPEQHGQELYNISQEGLQTLKQPLPNVVTRSMTKRLKRELSSDPPIGPPPNFQPKASPKSIPTMETTSRRINHSISRARNWARLRKTSQGQPGIGAAGTGSTSFNSNSSEHLPLTNAVGIKNEASDKSTEPWINQLLQAAMHNSNDTRPALPVKREMSDNINPSISSNSSYGVNSATNTGPRDGLKVEGNRGLVKVSQRPLDTVNMAIRSRPKRGPKVKKEVAGAQARIQTSGAGARKKGTDSTGKTVKEEVGTSTQNPILLE